MAGRERIRLLCAMFLVGACAEALDKLPFDSTGLEDVLASGDEKADRFLEIAEQRGAIADGESKLDEAFVADKVAAYEFVEQGQGAQGALDLAVDSADADPVLMVYGPRQDDGGFPVRIAKDDDSDGKQPRLVGLRLPVAGTYLIVVAEYDRAPGHFALRVTRSIEQSPAPAAPPSVPSPPPLPACDKPVVSMEAGGHNPGMNCMMCHQGSNRFPWTIAGTLYADANGAVPLSGATIRIVDASGAETKLVTARNGNFYSTTAVRYPLTVKASRCPDNAKMGVTITAPGSCNAAGCHDPGRRLHLP